jgi:hypothetical protein
MVSAFALVVVVADARARNEIKFLIFINNNVPLANPEGWWMRFATGAIKPGKNIFSLPKETASSFV